MGNFLPPFSIGYTRSKSLNKLHKNSCDFSLEKTKKLIEKKIKKLEKILKRHKTTYDPSTSKDYIKYGLFPGQQIRRTIKSFIPHTAIYIYDGIIFEMGSGPKKCSKKLGNPFTISEHLCGLSTLHSFETYAKRSGSHIYKIDTNKDSDSEEILKRLNRVLEIVGKYDYSIFTNNCLHMANFVSHNNRSLIHIKNINKNILESNKRRIKRRSKKK